MERYTVKILAQNSTNVHGSRYGLIGRLTKGLSVIIRQLSKPKDFIVCEIGNHDRKYLHLSMVQFA